MTHEQNASFDKSWQAFLYAHGEMSTDEMTAFESQLENDTELCELVAEAVILADAVAETAHQPMVAKPVQNERFAATSFWTSTLLTACLVMMLMVGNSLRTPTSQNNQLVNDSSSSFEEKIADDKMIRIWVDSKVETSPMEADRPMNAVGSAELETQELNVPDWMLAAVKYETIENVEDETTPLDHEEI